MASKIESEVLKPYLEYEANLKQYEGVLSEAIQKENPLSSGTRQDLKNLQNYLGLKESHVLKIESQIIPQKAFARKLIRNLAIFSEFIVSIITQIANPRNLNTNDLSIKIKHYLSEIRNLITKATKPKATDQVSEYILNRIASRRSRLFSSIVNYCIAAPPFVLLLVGLINSEGFSITFGILFTSLLIITQAFLLSSQGQTIGKKIFKLKIVNIDTGKNNGFLTNVLIRTGITIALSIPTYTGYLMVDSLFIFRQDKRCLHDLMARTCVIRI